MGGWHALWVAIGHAKGIGLALRIRVYDDIGIALRIRVYDHIGIGARLGPNLGPWGTVIINGPPNLGLLSINILMAADELVVPVQAHYLAQVQLSQLFATLE